MTKILKHHPVLSPPVRGKVHELIIHPETLASNVVFKKSFLVVQQKPTRNIIKQLSSKLKKKERKKKQNKTKKLFPESLWGLLNASYPFS